MSARICITGATGYLGRALCRKLDRAGTRRVLDVAGIRAA